MGLPTLRPHTLRPHTLSPHTLRPQTLRPQILRPQTLRTTLCVPALCAHTAPPCFTPLHFAIPIHSIIKLRRSIALACRLTFIVCVRII